MKNISMRSGLMATTTICGFLAGALVTAAIPTGALAQDATKAADKKDDKVTEVIVTGSIIRQKNLKSNSPMTVLTAGDLEKRGVTTIESAIQNLSGNGSGALPNSFSSNGAFAAGASAASLRGLTTDSTLVLINGLRASYYPLADDGTRNFVDLNTIPDAIVDRVEVLQDGGSSTYGADAIGGVINIITKKQFTGVTMKATAGTSEKGGDDMSNLAATWGKGNLKSDGYNFYVSAEYQKNDMFKSSERGYPYNTDDFSGLCAPSVLNSGTGVVNGQTCRTNGVQNGIQFDGTLAGIGSTIVAVVRPYNASNTTAAGNYRLLNPALGCGTLTSVTLNSTSAISGAPAGTVLCQQDNRKLFRVISPEDTRASLSGRFTKQFNDDTQGYVEGTYYNNKAFYSGIPSALRATTTPASTGVTVTSTTLALPVYVCPRGTTVACTSTNGTLNPNNPFAAAGQVARIWYSFGDIPFYTKEDSKTIRVAAGLSGVAIGWNYNVDATAMKTDLDYTQAGRIYYPHLLDVVADGSYNFADPSKNTQAVRDYVSPTAVQKSSSELDMIQASASKPLLDLAGGPLSLGLGASLRYERVSNPSLNPDTNGAANRYFSINPFGAVGNRNVQSVNFELDAPIFTQWDVNLSGRYDKYSTHYSSFSPKISTKWKILEQLTFRGAFSKGFRAPAFAETNSDPTTGFVTANAPASFLAAHNNDGYGLGYSLGTTTLGAKNLRPEKSENTTLGFIYEPTHYLGFTVDYYNIHKTDVIAGGDTAPAIAAYYAGTTIPTGFQIVTGPVDPLAPNAKPVIAYVITQKQNLNAQDVAGVDFAATARFTFGSVKWTSVAQATYVQYFNQTFPTGVKQRFAGTLGPYQTTSASGTPKLRSNWQNTFEFGKASITATAYYTSGYAEKADDNGDAANFTCPTYATAAKYRDGKTVVVCSVKSFIDVDLHGSYQLTSQYSLALDVSNLLAAKAPYDPTTYGASNYNPAWANAGIIGRYFKLTAKATF